LLPTNIYDIYLYVVGKTLRVKEGKKGEEKWFDVKQGAEERSSLGRKLLFSRYSGNQQVIHIFQTQVNFIIMEHYFPVVICNTHLSDKSKGKPFLFISDLSFPGYIRSGLVF
jgi:hypothetical protein